MDMLLLDAFGRWIPDTLSKDVIQIAEVCIAKFSSSSGAIVLYDTDTWLLKAPLVAHVGQITSLDWSSKGSHLLTASKDWTCVVWDLVNYPQRTIVRTDSQLVAARFLPGSVTSFIVIPIVGPIQRITIESPDDGSHPDARLKRHTVEMLTFDDQDYELLDSLLTNVRDECSCQYTCFDFCLESYIVVGSSRGSLTLLDCNDGQVLGRVKVSLAAIKGVEYNAASGVVLVNSADRQIRTFKLNKFAFSFLVKFQDLVEKIAWCHCTFSNNGEYVVGGSADKQKHNVYIWDSQTATLEKMLEGPFESLDYFDWHPLKSQIVTLSVIGRLYRWDLKHKENWSAFAPGFEELEDNIEYQEREDEFDTRPEIAVIDSCLDADLSVVSIEADDVFLDHFVFTSHPL